jgi:NTP pyrophosphatase (non-canonical NTP hydrolase)
MSKILELEKERFAWALKTFPEATAIASLRKLEGEIKEVEEALLDPAIDKTELAEEYADCLMCLFDSAGRAGVFLDLIFHAFGEKLEKNKKRTWAKNPDNSYSHIKGDKN